jgi:hypothetical protein
VYTVSLCRDCAPALFEKCGILFFPDKTQDKARPADPESTAPADPALMEKARLFGEAMAAKLYIRACDGDEDAAARLAELTFACVTYLDNLAECQPELLRPAARICTCWPSFIGKRKVVVESADQLLERLEVGKLSVVGGRLTQDSAPQKVALSIYHWLMANTSTLRLPPISPRTASAWFEVGWRRLLMAVDNRPDLHPFLSPIGKSARNDKRAVTRGLPSQTPAMRRSDVTAKIKELVRKSFMAVLPSHLKRDTSFAGGS